jgi:hypothetical protein
VFIIMAEQIQTQQIITYSSLSLAISADRRQLK